MTIPAGTDPSLPISLSCSIRSNGELEVKYGSSSLTHPQELLHVDVDDLDAATFQTSNFGSYTIDATTVEGDDWSGSSGTVISEALHGDVEPGKEHAVVVTASDGGTPKTATIRVRIREININPIPPP